MSAENPFQDEGHRLQAARNILGHPEFEVITDLLYRFERSLIRDLRDRESQRDPADVAVALKTIDELRNSLRTLATKAGVPSDRPRFRAV